ncbi:unnamed protein product [Adineta steineri]|uniref:NAD(P)(+)--arginine ADP-ribosyltransferase n=2 Tax=Adineta steineri TaxID=433720 RepID=A0A819KSZ7_9BILA|nr:unnamed protein product [Adineta steineri]
MATGENVDPQQYIRVSDIVNEPQKMLMPIEGYEEMPIVPLEKAVASLISILPKVQNYVYTAKHRCESIPPDDLTQDESASIMLYSMEWEPHEKCLYFALNAALRTEDRRKLKPWFSYLKLLLTALEKLPSTPCHVFRGVNLDLSNLYIKGKIFVWWGFSSCTPTIEVLENEQFLGKTGQRTLFTIECDSGKDIIRHSYYQKEKEVLLLPARQFIVVSCLRPGPDLHIIQLKETKPLITLLQPVTNQSMQSKSTPEHKSEDEIILRMGIKFRVKINVLYPNGSYFVHLIEINEENNDNNHALGSSIDQMQLTTKATTTTTAATITKATTTTNQISLIRLFYWISIILSVLIAYFCFYYGQLPEKSTIQCNSSINCSASGGGGNCIPTNNPPNTYTCTNCTYGADVINGTCPSSPCTGSVNCNSAGGGGTCQPIGSGNTGYKCIDCSSGADVMNGACPALTCTDGVKNQDESDVDCGGAICSKKCSPQQGCKSSSDCANNNCDTTTKKCLAPTCTDGVKNQDESDVDCGGAACSKKCSPQQGCSSSSDCSSNNCDTKTKKCLAPTCTDGIKNYDETDVDCGGAVCSKKCLPQQGCKSSSDCTSNNCDTTTKKCLAPTCTDDVKNQDESDVDCGGAVCSKKCLPQQGSPTCTDGIKNQDESDVDCGGAICSKKCLPQQGCTSRSDCTSNNCDKTTKKCLAPTCIDGIKNQGESDVDCGGAICLSKCLPQESCKSSSDCTSNNCDKTTKKCLKPTCTDGVKNQGESDVDCGGAICLSKCLPQQSCTSNSDCASNNCDTTTKKCLKQMQATKNKFQQFAITVAGRYGNGEELYQLDHPQGIFIDNDTSIYIADYENHCIVKWKLNSNEGEIIAGGNGRGNKNNQLNSPNDIIFDQEKNSFIISEWGNQQVIRYFDQNPAKRQIIISNIRCCGLTIDKNGFIYVSDYVNHEVRRWKQGDTKGELVAGGNGRGNQLNQLYYPTKIFIDKDYSLYISDSNNHRVMKWKKDAKEGIIVAGGNGQGNSLKQLSGPRGVVVDHLGQIYVADRDNHRVMRWCEGDKEGEIVVGGNGWGNQSNQLDCPEGLSFDNKGNLYIVDRNNHRVQKYENYSKTNVYEDLGKLTLHMNDCDMNTRCRQKSLLSNEQNQLTTNSNIDEANKSIGKFIER